MPFSTAGTFPIGTHGSGRTARHRKTEPPLGLNNDPLGVFTVVEKDGAPAIRVSGEVFGAITTKEEFGNCHIRVEYKWGEKKWPPREQPKHYRDTGILYWCIGEHGAGSGAWMRSVECNIMERGVGQWWAVAGTYVDIEGRKVVLEKEPSVPYRGESPGETCILWQPGAPAVHDGRRYHFAARSGEGRRVERVRGDCVGQRRHSPAERRGRARGHESALQRRRDAKCALTRGKIQLQSEGAEVFFRKAEVRPHRRRFRRHCSNTFRRARRTRRVSFRSSARRARRTGRSAARANSSWRMAWRRRRGGMGLWWFTNRTFTNFVLRGEFVQEQPIADSGVFVRFPNPGNDPWVAVKRGHEFEIGDPNPENPTWRTGSMYPFKAATKANTRALGEWNSVRDGLRRARLFGAHQRRSRDDVERPEAAQRLGLHRPAELQRQQDGAVPQSARSRSCRPERNHERPAHLSSSAYRLRRMCSTATAPAIQQLRARGLPNRALACGP